MVYKVIGLMSGSSLDGLDIAYTQFQETAGKWSFEIIHADTYAYSAEWADQLQHATSLTAEAYQLLHTAYGRYTGEQVNRFIDLHGLHHNVHLVASHGHTTFHNPANKMTAQLGDGAAIAAVTQLPVISDLRAVDVAFGGQGAPIVPIGEKLLLGAYDFLLNLGGIANVSAKNGVDYIAFDICAANRLLNMLANTTGKEMDEDGRMAAQGNIHDGLLQQLNGLAYYGLPYPKSLDNNFGFDTVYPLIVQSQLPVNDALRTYVEHICIQIWQSLSGMVQPGKPTTLLITGGGALNNFLVTRLQEVLNDLSVNIVIPDKSLVQFKEAVIMGLIGVLRWREEYNVLASVTGAMRNSIGGALWLGGEA